MNEQPPRRTAPKPALDRTSDRRLIPTLDDLCVAEAGQLGTLGRRPLKRALLFAAIYLLFIPIAWLALGLPWPRSIAARFVVLAVGPVIMLAGEWLGEVWFRDSGSPIWNFLKALLFELTVERDRNGTITAKPAP